MVNLIVKTTMVTLTNKKVTKVRMSTCKVLVILFDFNQA